MNSKRIAHNFLMSRTGGTYQPNDVDVLSQVLDYEREQKELKEFKVALLFICLNEPYWEFAKEAMEGADKFFLPGHKVDKFLWSDMPAENHYGATVFKTEGLAWPAPTLYRYHLFLQQEKLLEKYDYVFYCDIDMRFVNVVGDEVLGDGVTAAQHPMYALKKQLWPPYEPNVDSASYIPRPGKVISDGGKPRFMPLYYAGGFQGGTALSFIKAAKGVKELIDKDENERNYTPIWNDESAWNRYLFDNPPSIVLTPSYIYPDTLIKEYYEPLWGTSYPPKLVTLTKKFSVKQLTPEEHKELMSMQKI